MWCENAVVGGFLVLASPEFSKTP
ncbi:hypothetical protein D046_0954A, partial [Vibrio parahaemolyticus V-223/04]